MSKTERADIFFMALTGMTTDELARKIVSDYNIEQKSEVYILNDSGMEEKHEKA